ncbi:MAG: DNA mismatch repair endonuclease MutL [Phycisphaerae bacterium]|jgi:DNA mismatch repair protein MutL|nr:DNA mismatch repair endonuclease MutL [Phycisphaerae bacterium]
MPIRVLPVHLVNKIAAGEVIERPASIVKELVENSLDAGATRIEVTIEDGGKKLICVSDNGCGMDADDLSRAFVPHATSKLPSEDDLFNISTMGFRGEALASVGSISHAHIRTRRADSPDGGGFEISASGQTVEEVRPCASAPGSTVTVRDLFFNTPARRKFLRTANTESAHVTEQVARLALPHPNVAFLYKHNGRKVHDLPACETTRQRIGDLFGDDLADSLISVPKRGDDTSMAALIGPPSAARGSGKWQYFFLNGRYIRDRVLSHSLREAYRGLLDPRRWPVAFIFIEVPPADVDVNVHPSKIEVRFKNSQQVHVLILASLRETLNKSNLTPSASAEPDVFATPEVDDETAQRQDSLRNAMADFFKSAPPPQPHLSFPETHSPGMRRRPDPPSVESYPLPMAQPPPVATEPYQAPPSPVPVHTPPTTGLMAFQVQDSYIVAQCPDGLIIVDQHALHERIIYNDLKNRLASGSLTAQRMLIPLTVTVTAAEADLLEANEQLLSTLGVEVAPFGPDTVAIQQFPTLLAERGVHGPEFLQQVLDKLREDPTADAEQLIEGILQVMACKAAIKANQPLSRDEMESLLARRDEIDKASSCPHGRPTTLKLTVQDLEKQFKRT